MSVLILSACTFSLDGALIVWQDTNYNVLTGSMVLNELSYITQVLQFRVLKYVYWERLSDYHFYTYNFWRHTVLLLVEMSRRYHQRMRLKCMHTSIIITIPSPSKFEEDINSIIDNINDWFRDNSLSLNFYKMYFLQFRPKNSYEITVFFDR